MDMQPTANEYTLLAAGQLKDQTSFAVCIDLYLDQKTTPNGFSGLWVGVFLLL
jgi:hypothetical protein